MAQRTDPIRVDMSAEDDGLGEAIMTALLTGRPLVMHDTTRPELGEVGLGMEIEAAPEVGAA